MKSTTGITTKIIAMIAAIIVALSFSSLAKVFADDGPVDWGYGNIEKTVRWDLTEEDGRNVLTFTVLDSASTEKEKAITQILNKNGQRVNNNFKNSINEVRVEEGITGIGWTALYERNPNKPPAYPDDYPINKNETGVFQDFANLETVRTCSTIKRIGWSAFRRCYSLKSIDFDKMKNLEEIMDQAFAPCGLETADLSGCTSLKTIHCEVFSGAGANKPHPVSEIILPAKLEIIGFKAFTQCKQLRRVIFKDISSVKTVYDNAFSGQGKQSTNPIEYIQDDATKRRAATRPRAVKELFTGVDSFPDNAVYFTDLEETDWVLDVTVKNKLADYNGEEQYGYEVKDVTGAEDDPCTVSGLKDGHVLSMTSSESDTGYKPSHGTEPGKYTNGAFKTDKPGIKAMYEGYDYGINYVLGTTAAGALTIRPVVTFVNYNDKVLSKTAYDKGTAAGDIIRPTDPTRDSDAQYDYEFDGWEPDIVDVSGNATYKAKYKATVREYNVKFVNDDGTVLQDTKEKYGSTPSYKGSTPKKNETDKYTYEFKGWTPEISKVTGNATYKAVFTTTAKPKKEKDDTPKRRTTPASGMTQRPASGGNSVTPSAPADDGTVIPDAPVPQTDPEEAEVIPDEPVPQTEPDVETGAWALLNLIMAILTVIGAILALLRRREDEDDDSSRLLILAAKIVSIIVAILAPIVFFLTEDMTLPMTMTDRFTWLMALILAIQIAAAIVIKRASEAYEEDDE